MSDEAAAVETGVGTEAGGETPAPKYLTLKDLQAALTAWSDPFAKKVNGELAAFRKKIEGQASGGTPAQTESAPKGSEPKALTAADFGMLRELGRLEGSLPKDVQADLQGDEEFQAMTPNEQVRLLRQLAKRTASGETPGDRGADPKPKSSPRATPAAGTTPPSRPKTLAEYAELAKSDPKRKAALDADDSFDPTELPRR